MKPWRKVYELTLAVQRATSETPQEDMCGSVKQLRRATSSALSELMEDGKDSEFAIHVQKALSSASEAEHHLLTSYNLGYFDAESFQTLMQNVTEVKQALTRLLSILRAKS